MNQTKDNTPTKLTAEELEKIRERCEKATEGPWVRWREHESIHAGPLKENRPGILRGGRGQVCDLENMDFPKAQTLKNLRFIAASRTDIPALLSHIKAQEAELRDLTEAAFREGWTHRNQYGQERIAESGLDRDWGYSQTKASLSTPSSTDLKGRCSQ